MPNVTTIAKPESARKIARITGDLLVSPEPEYGMRAGKNTRVWHCFVWFVDGTFADLRPMATLDPSNWIVRPGGRVRYHFSRTFHFGGACAESCCGVRIGVGAGGRRRSSSRRIAG